MSYEQFEIAVIELASRGTRLTVANVVAALGVAPKCAEEWLDQMAKSSRLECELDEAEGVVFYKVRGLSSVPAPGWWAGTRYVRPAPKSALAGALLGLLVPGMGLLYAAPVSAAALATIAIFIAVKMAAAIPLLGLVLAPITLGVAALCSAALGAAYVKQYNSGGRRVHLHDPRDAADPRPYVRAVTAHWT